jgi:hypothetical protein
MRSQIIRPIIAGILLGAALYFMPFFLLRIVLIILVITFIWRLFTGGRFSRRYNRGFHPAFADHIRSMTEEQYKAFRQSLDSNYRPDDQKPQDSKTSTTHP